MLKLKYKYFAATLFFILLAGQLLLFFVVPVSANHGSCDGTSIPSFRRCEASRRQIANEQCYTSNAGNNNAIATCVQRVTSHFEFSGPGDVPPLPGEPAPVIRNPIDTEDCRRDDLNAGNCTIIGYIDFAINTLSVLVGIVVTIMIIIGGIQYSASREDPNAVAKAKKHISQAVMALVAYGLTFAFLQYIIPGGLL